MTNREGMNPTPDELARKIREEKKDKNTPLDNIPDVDVARGVVHTSETPEKPDEPDVIFDGGIEALIKEVTTKDDSKDKAVESESVSAIITDAADLYAEGDLDGVKRMIRDDEKLLRKLAEELQRRSKTEKPEIDEGTKDSSLDTEDDAKPAKTKRSPVGGIAPDAKERLGIDLAEAAKTIEKINEETSDTETQNEVAPRILPEAEQKDEERAEEEPEIKVFESTSEDTSTSGEGVTLESSSEQNVRRDAVKKELDETADEAKKARDKDAAEAQWEDEGGSIETPADDEVPAEPPKDKKTWNEWEDDVSERVKAGTEGLSYDKKLAYESLLAYAHGGELTEHAKEHIDLLRNEEGFEDLLELMREASENGGNQEFQDALEAYLSELNIEADFEGLVREYLESERDGDTDRMQEIKDELNELLDRYPDKEELFLEVSERISDEMGTESDNENTEGGGIRSLAKEMLQPRVAAKYLSEAGDEIGKALLGMGLGLHDMARKSGTYRAAGRGLGVLAFIAGGLSWLAYKGAKMALNYAYKRASKYTPPGLKKVFDKMIESSAQPSKGGGKSTGKK